MALAFRRATDDDLPYVVNSFLDNYKLAHTAGLVSIEDWDGIMGGQFRKLLARPRVAVHVAFNPDADENPIHGWIATESGSPPTVVYCYVKQAYRRLGIGRALFREAGIDPRARFNYAAKTAVVSTLRHVMPGGEFRPLDIRFPPK